MHDTTKYAKRVVSGKIVACRWVKMACRRHLKDLKRNDVYFDKDAADHAIGFFRFLKHSKGEWAGTVFVPELWQRFIIGNIFGWKRKKDDLRKYRTVYIEVARKNGKSTLLSGIGIYLFVADGEPGAEIFSAATKREQARICHAESIRMVKKSPDLRKRISIFKDNMNIPNTASLYEPLGADANTMDGLNVHGALIDELHAHKTRDTWDVLETATGARRQPLQIAITTAGVDQAGICYEQHQYVKQVLSGAINDDTYFGIIYTLDLKKDFPKLKKEDDWTDESVWGKANPNLGVSAKLDDMQRKCKKAMKIPPAQNNFLRKHLDVWTQQVSRWIDLDLWDQNNGGGVYVEN